MPVVKKSDGWYWGSKGPFATKTKALQVAQAAYASGYKEEGKKKGAMTFGLDFNGTYNVDPKFWNVFIELCRLRKDEVYCVTHSTDPDENKELLQSIGQVIGEDHCIFSDGHSKMEAVAALGIEIDIWIDNNPIHIFQDPGY
jgi:hypothetical protein